MPAVEASIAGQEGICLQSGMGPNEEVRDNPFPANAGTLAALPPQSSSSSRRLRGDGVKLNPKKAYGFKEGFVGGEMCPDLGPHHLAGRQRPGIIGGTECLPGPFPEGPIRTQDVEED